MFAPIPANDLNLRRSQVDIWQFSLARFPDNFSNLLRVDEILRANRFHFERHRRRFIIARSLLRLLLARYLQVSPADIVFDYNAHGKPFIRDASSIEFNLSHSDDLALLAIGQQAPLGIDLEFFSNRPYRGIAKNLFSDAECKALNQLTRFTRPLGFFHIWAQKEAFIKATGLGLAYPTQEFTVPHHLPSNQAVYDVRHQKTWQLISFMPQVACCAALCFEPQVVTTLRFGVYTPFT